MQKIYLARSECELSASEIAEQIRLDIGKTPIHIYGVPRGGIPVAYMVSRVLTEMSIQNEVVYSVKFADAIVDDIIDTGKTKARYPANIPFYALMDREGVETAWFVFPWECDEMADTSAFDIVTRFLQRIGEDPKRNGLLETPARVVKSWEELYKGYKIVPAELFKTFEEPCDEMVILRNIEFYSMCEHHCLPFFGKVHIAYIPNGKVVGVSKLARLVECYSRRLQIQERLTQQIVTAIEKHLSPTGVACFIEAQHLCMMSRGVEKQNSIMVTSAIRGVFKDKDAARLEFLLLNGRGGL